MLTEDDIKKALSAVKYPGYSRDIVSFGLVKQIAAKDGVVSVAMQLTTANPEERGPTPEMTRDFPSAVRRSICGSEERLYRKT